MFCAWAVPAVAPRRSWSPLQFRGLVVVAVCGFRCFGRRGLRPLVAVSLGSSGPCTLTYEEDTPNVTTELAEVLARRIGSPMHLL
eukprot:12607166-Alexandrium_andersonii.AAC.1